MSDEREECQHCHKVHSAIMRYDHEFVERGTRMSENTKQLGNISHPCKEGTHQLCPQYAGYCRCECHSVSSAPQGEQAKCLACGSFERSRPLLLDTCDPFRHTLCDDSWHNAKPETRPDGQKCTCGHEGLADHFHLLPCPLAIGRPAKEPSVLGGDEQEEFSAWVREFVASRRRAPTPRDAWQAAKASSLPDICAECKTRGIPGTRKWNWPLCDDCLKLRESSLPQDETIKQLKEALVAERKSADGCRLDASRMGERAEKAETEAASLRSQVEELKQELQRKIEESNSWRRTCEKLQAELAQLKASLSESGPLGSQ